MAQHPSLTTLESFLEGSLGVHERREVLRHLLGRCDACINLLQPAIAAHFGGVPGARRYEPAEYEAVIDRALDRTALLAVGEKPSSREDRQGEDRYAVYEALLDHTAGLRHDNPELMVQAALNVVAVSQQLGVRHGFSPENLADMQARAAMELANALRVADRLWEAEAQIDRASQLLAEGTGSPSLSLRLRDIRASLLSARHCYPEALALLSEIESEHRRTGNRHGAGRSLLAQASLVAQLGDPQEALWILERAKPLIDPAREPDLARIVAHNRLLMLMDAGRFEEALEHLRESEAVLASGGRLDQARGLWARGRIFAVLGRLDLAESALRQAREELAALGTGAHAALAGLELATLLLRRGEREEARRYATEALDIFTGLKIRDPQVEAVLVLGEALREDLLTVGLLQSVSDFLRISERDPKARYQGSAVIRE